MGKKGRATSGRNVGRGSSARSYLTDPLTPKEVRRETRASTNLRFRPLERAIGADVRASQQRGREVGDWWQNYLNTVSAGQADTQAAYDQANTTFQGQIAQNSALDSANTAKLQEEAAKSAELRGTAVDMSGAQREVAAQAQRNYLGTAQAGALSAAGANQRGYLNEQKRIGAGQRIASGKEEQRRERSLRKDRRDVRRERGDYATTFRGELRDKERDYLIQRSAFNLDRKEAAQDAREGARDAREKAGDRRYDRQQDRVNNRQEQERIGISRKNANEKESSGRTPAEKRESREGQRNANATARSLFEQKKWPSWSALERAVRKESEVSPTEAHKAVARLRRETAASKQGNRGAPGKTKVPYAP